MEVLNVDIDEIKPYHRNPRKNQKAVPEVLKSIREFGFRQPLVVDKDMVLIVGHTRLLAARELGLTKVPVHIAKDMSDAQAMAYRIADNRSGERSDWDRDLLLSEIDDLHELEPRYDASFLDFEIDAIDEPTQFKTYDVSDVQDEFVLTIRGPLTMQAEVREALREFDGSEGFKVEVSHIKRKGKRGG